MRGRLVSLTLAVSFLATTLAPVGAGLSIASVSLDGPEFVAPGASALLEGAYDAPIRGGALVQVFVDGARVAQGRTASDGTFSISTPFPTVPGEHYARAIVRPALGASTPVDPASAWIVVRVKAPAPPGSLTATPLDGEPTVRLAWAAPPQDPLAPRQAFRVDSRPAFGAWTRVADVGPDATGLDVPAALGSSPSFRVFAVGTGGHLGEAAQATAAPPAPGAPTGLTAVLQATTVDLAWTAPTSGGPLQGFKVYRGGELRATLPASATSYADPTVLAGSYRFIVVAANVGPSGASDSVDLAIRGPSALASFAAAGTDAPGVELSWTHGDLGDATSASTRIERLVQSFPHSHWRIEGTTTGTTFTVTGLEPGTTHAFRLTPTTTRGAAPASQTSATTPWPDVWFPLSIGHRYCARSAGSTGPYACSDIGSGGTLTIASGREFTLQPTYAGRVVLDGEPTARLVEGTIGTARDGGAPTSLAWSLTSWNDGRFSGNGPVLGPFTTVGDGWTTTFATTLTAESGGAMRSTDATLIVETPPPPPPPEE